jgi:hypothetical protein
MFPYLPRLRPSDLFRNGEIFWKANISNHHYECSTHPSQPYRDLTFTCRVCLEAVLPLFEQSRGYIFLRVAVTFFLASEGIQYKINVRCWSYPSFIITFREMDNGDRFIAHIDMPVLLFAHMAV